MLVFIVLLQSLSLAVWMLGGLFLFEEWSWQTECSSQGKVLRQIRRMSEKCLFDTNEVRRVSVVRSDSWRKRRAMWQMRRRQYLSMTGKSCARWLCPLLRPALQCIHFSYNRSQQGALYFDVQLYMFRSDLLSNIRSLNAVFTTVGIFHTIYVACLLARLRRQHK